VSPRSLHPGIGTDSDRPTQLTCRKHAPRLANVVSSTAALNSLPADLHDITDTNTFKKWLKTVLFDRVYWLVITVVRLSWTVRRAAPYKSPIVLYCLTICLSRVCNSGTNKKHNARPIGSPKSMRRWSVQNSRVSRRLSGRISSCCFNAVPYIMVFVCWAMFCGNVLLHVFVVCSITNLLTYLFRNKTTSRTRTRCADSWRWSYVTSLRGWKKLSHSLRRKESDLLPNYRQR